MLRLEHPETPARVVGATICGMTVPVREDDSLHVAG